ncbi:MAG TPA: nitroreductase family protein [bacterium]|nr:nitroreductase family protein [bacterium]HQP98038.1 nitroreductase family protein [bacterium]
MENIAKTDHPVMDVIKRRWSPRAISNRPVEPEKLRIVLEAARWAPSCYNNQSWRFLVATRDDPVEFERMLGCLVEQNIVWARSAPVLMICVAPLNLEFNGQPNRHAFFDAGLASENMILQAVDLGLCVHPMAGFSPDRTREIYHVPEGFEPITAFAIGYPGDPESLPDNLKQMELAPRTRRPIREFVFTGDWGRTAPVVQE